MFTSTSLRSCVAFFHLVESCSCSSCFQHSRLPPHQSRSARIAFSRSPTPVYQALFSDQDCRQTEKNSQTANIGEGCHHDA